MLEVLSKVDFDAKLRLGGGLDEKNINDINSWVF